MWPDLLPWCGIGLAVMLLACQQNDIGAPCPQLLGGAPAVVVGDDPTVTYSENVIATGGDFEPCASLTCVATQGRDGYCSTPCVDDAGCPSGFSCSVVQAIGPYAGQTFCTWKTCRTRADCGGKHFCCEQVTQTADTPQFKQCAFSTDGQCP
jgi:hypothetical protein